MPSRATASTERKTPASGPSAPPAAPSSSIQSFVPSPGDLAAQLAGLKQRVDETDRLRARAEARHEEAARQLTEVDKKIQALGVKPEEAEAFLQTLEAQLATELATIEAALQAEAAAYREIVK